ncbi:MAG TPA: aldolase/citrate lyase family protein [Opitutaceae bacterium]|nr:aldolase/citrate lyase family protein [Opitutaceae bacterium]
MNPSPTFKKRVLAREWLTGTFINLGSPVTAEIAAHAGFDWILIDHEHGAGGEDTMFNQLRAVGGAPAAPIVRIPANEAWRFKRVLDAGAHGVMVPFVNSADDARTAVTAMRYPPAGIRGVARFHRGAAYGADFDDYFNHANERLVLVAQIETPAGVANVEAIAAVDGVDVLFVGPTDLTYNMGIPEQYEHPDYMTAQRRVVAASNSAGKAAGILVHNPALVAASRDLGFTFVALGSDGGAVRTGLLNIAATLRTATPPG